MNQDVMLSDLTKAALVCSIELSNVALHPILPLSDKRDGVIGLKVMRKRRLISPPLSDKDTPYQRIKDAGVIREVTVPLSARVGTNM